MCSPGQFFPGMGLRGPGAGPVLGIFRQPLGSSPESLVWEARAPGIPGWTWPAHLREAGPRLWLAPPLTRPGLRNLPQALLLALGSDWKMLGFWGVFVCVCLLLFFVLTPVLEPARTLSKGKISAEWGTFALVSGGTYGWPWTRTKPSARPPLAG